MSTDILTTIATFSLIGIGALTMPNPFISPVCFFLAGWIQATGGA